MNKQLKKDKKDAKARQRRYMAKMQTLCVTLSKSRDADIIAWLERQENRSEAVRNIIRMEAEHETDRN